MGPFAVSRVSEELQPALQPTIPMKQLPLPLAPPTHPLPSVAVDVGGQPTTEQQVRTYGNMHTLQSHSPRPPLPTPLESICAGIKVVDFTNSVVQACTHAYM